MSPDFPSVPVGVPTMQLIDLTGQKFGMLTVLKQAKSPPKTQAKWLCRCDCGKEISVYGCNLRQGLSTSCGSHRKTHGRSKTNLYHIYYNKRRIGVCEEWDTFEKFEKWCMENDWHKGCIIQRRNYDDIFTLDNTYITEGR